MIRFYDYLEFLFVMYPWAGTSNLRSFGPPSVPSNGGFMVQSSPVPVAGFMPAQIITGPTTRAALKAHLGQRKAAKTFTQRVSQHHRRSHPQETTFTSCNSKTLVLMNKAGHPYHQGIHIFTDDKAIAPGTRLTSARPSTRTTGVVKCYVGHKSFYKKNAPAYSRRGQTSYVFVKGRTKTECSSTGGCLNLNYDIESINKFL